ncbi:MAG: cytochrome c [Gammaproteobacteria bacterium]|nr:cytochrome c [Gammaproteobacteria bacterium]
MQQKLIGVLATLTLILGTSLTAIAETSAEDAADYRLAVMTSLRGHMTAASMIVRGLVEDNGYLAKHAKGLEMSVSEVHRVFPEGSNVGESNALPAIWEDTDKFKAAIEKAENASAAFVAAAKSGGKDEIGGAFRNLGGSCRGCHDDFKMSDD